jgi:predicted transcriptional regulator
MTKLQEILIKKISSTTDERILQEVNRLLETGADEDIYQLTPEQIAGIEESREQIKNGQFLTNEEANKEIQEWLKNR